MHWAHTPIQKYGFCSAFLQGMKRVDNATLETGKSNHYKETLIVSLSKNIQGNAISTENFFGNIKCCFFWISLTAVTLNADR